MVRRLVALFVLALVVAGLYGLSDASSGISVNHQHVNGATFRGELTAIAQHSTLNCFITALDPTNYAAGSGGDTIAASGASAWADLRVEGLAINQYVTTKLHYVPNTTELASAKASLESEMTDQAKSNSLTCPGTSSQAIAEMPGEMRTAEIQAQATSLYLVAKLKKAIPLTTVSMESYYKAHQSDYDTLCVSIALVTPSQVAVFAKAESTGESVADLAKAYSQDPSGESGGAYGCFAPSNASYVGVRSDVNGLALDTFPTTPQYINYSGGTYALYVAVTKRTATPFAKAEATVLSDLRSLNAESANTVKNNLLYRAAVHVDPAFGRWGLNTTGPQVFAPATPAKAVVTGATKLTAAAASYR